MFPIEFEVLEVENCPLSVNQTSTSVSNNVLGTRFVRALERRDHAFAKSMNHPIAH